MNSERLLEAFSKIEDDPDRIQQLRKIAIALAVSGKLDKGAATLSPRQVLDAVDRVKADLAKKGLIPKPKKHAEVTLEQLPAAFSDVTRFAPLGELATIEKGQTGIQQAQRGAFPLVVTAAERATCDHFDFDGSAAIIPLVSSTGHGNASINRLHYHEGKFALGTILVAVFPHDPNLISARFLFEYLSAFKEELLVTRMTGTANVTLSVGRVADVPIPLICPEVQRKVDELMALCDQLEQARAGREAVRDRLTAASLARLTAPDTDAEALPAEVGTGSASGNATNKSTFQSHARFALQSLPMLTTRPDQIKALRQTILNLAVRGKLVAQDASDEPASELLKRIAKEKARLVKAGHIKKQKPLQPIDDQEKVFDLPSGWMWARLGDLSQFVTSGSRDWAKHYSNEGAIFVRMGNLSQGHYRLRLSQIQRVNVPSDGEGTRTRLESGDVLISITGDVGMLGLIPDDFGEAYINQHTAMVRLMPEIKGRFIPELFRSPFAQDQFNAPQRGIKNSFRLSDITQFVVPLPPIAEQQRIVTKVDELMALCDRLEASLATTDTTRQRLLEALLHEALEPVNFELEAAQ